MNVKPGAIKKPQAPSVSASARRIFKEAKPAVPREWKARRDMAADLSRGARPRRLECDRPDRATDGTDAPLGWNAAAPAARAAQHPEVPAIWTGHKCTGPTFYPTGYA